MTKRLKKQVVKTPWLSIMQKITVKFLLKIKNECTDLEPHTYQCAFKHLKPNIEPFLSNLRRGGTISFSRKHLHKQKKEWLAVETNRNKLTIS